MKNQKMGKQSSRFYFETFYLKVSWQRWLSFTKKNAIELWTITFNAGKLLYTIFKFSLDNGNKRNNYTSGNFHWYS